MKKLKSLLIITPFLILFGTLVHSQPASPADGFKELFQEFQAAVAQNNAEKIAAMVSFPKFRWEPLTDQDIKTKEDFLKDFPKMFTPEVKKKIAAAKFYKTPGGDYLFDWLSSHLQYTLAFDHQAGGGYKFSGMLMGPE